MRNPLVGKTVTGVWIAEDKQAMKFDLLGADPIIAKCDGDCCSTTWVENVQAPENCVGSTIVSVEDIPMPEPSYDKDKFDYLQFYGCKITSGKGETVIDYRNESNGYYGGSLKWPSKNRYYGGVYGQNISAEKWVKLA